MLVHQVNMKDMNLLWLKYPDLFESKDCVTRAVTPKLREISNIAVQNNHYSLDRDNF